MKNWTPEQEAVFRAEYATTDTRELAAKIGKTYTAVKSAATAQGLKKATGCHGKKMWNVVDDNLVRFNYPTGDLQKLCEVLGVSFKALYQRAKSLKVARDTELVAAKNKELALKAGVNTRFVKGIVAHNKGRKQSEFMTPEAIARTAATRFGKGNMPHNTKPIGYERFGKVGYVEVKVRDGCKQKNYVAKHRLVYEAHFGAIPEGMIVEFADGNVHNLAPENLRLSTRAENAERNRLKGPAIAKRFFGVSHDKAEAFANDYPDLIELKRKTMSLNGKLRGLRKKPGKPE